jgi:predicted DNA-binding transcriptional regulator AlpA
MSAAVVEAPAAVPARPWWSAAQLAAFFGLSRRSVWALVARGDLAQPHRFSAAIVRWSAADVDAFLERARTRRPT